MPSIGEFEKWHALLIVVARFAISCSLFATFVAQILKNAKILEEINHEDRNPYVVVRRALGCGDLWADQSKWPWNPSGSTHCSHFLKLFSIPSM